MSPTIAFKRGLEFEKVPHRIIFDVRPGALAHASASCCSNTASASDRRLDDALGELIW